MTPGQEVGTSQTASAIRPQRLVLVLPTTGLFDSRTYRIASAAVRRGHQVTVLARWAPGLARDERDPSGYRILRVSVSSFDGLPLPSRFRETLARRWSRRGRRSTAPSAELESASAAPEAASAAPASGAPASARSRLLPALAEPEAVGRAVRLRRALAGAARVAAIALTVRSQVRAARRVDPGADVYHAMAYMGIPVGLDLAGRAGGRVVYDARDIYIDANHLARLPRPARWLLGRLERGWARRADRVVTVNLPYATVMAERWALPAPAIVMNCAYRVVPSAIRPRRFHDRLGLVLATRVVLYHGGFSADRGIDQLIAAIGEVPNAVLVLLGYGSLAGSLERRAADPHLEGRLRVLPAVPPAELLDWVASADVVAMPIQPTTLNHRLTTPNKLFEAMAVGTPIVASDLPGMAAIVRESGAGLLVDPANPTAIAAALRTILDGPPDERAAMGRRALAAAHETYNWESQVEVLFAEYGLLTGRPW